MYWFCYIIFFLTVCALICMYSSMIYPYQLYHCKLILICNSIWFISTCNFFKNLAPWTSPKLYFQSVTLAFPQDTVVLWYGNSLLKALGFIFLLEKYLHLQYPSMKTCTWCSLLTHPFCPPHQVTCYTSLCLHSCLGTACM